MKYIIEIPEEVKEKFDNATTDDIYGSYYDYNSVIGNAIKNSTPLEVKLEVELEKIKNEIEDTGAYEQEVNGKTEFLKGINYCLTVIDKYKAEGRG